MVSLESTQTRPVSERTAGDHPQPGQHRHLEQAAPSRFPAWLRFGVYQSAVERLDELAVPRHLHTVDVYLWQRDEVT